MQRLPLTPKQTNEAFTEMRSAFFALRYYITSSFRYTFDEGAPRVSVRVGGIHYSVIAWLDGETGAMTYGWELVIGDAHHLDEHVHTTAWTATGDMLLSIAKRQMAAEISRQVAACASHPPSSPTP